ncbi:MAG: 4Fe-4S dicluster domain-containing protein [Acidobacteriota bacterium]|nr:4Fe-4S dicluster domain-containing protein [Acidobacteriota bacterium]
MGHDDVVVIDDVGLDGLIGALREAGFEPAGPVVRDGAIVPGAIRGVGDLPRGWHDRQAPGHYRLVHSDDRRYFAWAVGPASWKAAVFPPVQEVWRAWERDGALVVSEPPVAGAPMAVIGARPCELAALAVLDGVLGRPPVADPGYETRRERAFLVVVDCAEPGGSCFCTSMGTGPAAADGFDLALTELDDEAGHRFLVRAGTDRGARVLSALATRPATDAELGAREDLLERARAAMGRSLDTDDLPGLLARNLEHPRWDEVAARCLACGNCTSVCPTCFCSDVRDTTDVTGEVRRTRTWASCFDLDHSYLHGNAVRSSTRARYRQWMTHKLSTWWDQFGMSGCVGCGRCITWCPVGIDLTEEAAAIRASDGTFGPGSTAAGAPTGSARVAP